MFNQLGLIGCGLMGGSFALALKKAGLVKRVIGYSKSPSTTERARQLGVIDVAAASALMAVSGSDLVLLAVPVSATEGSLKSFRQLLERKTLVMDVGSTKSDVVNAAERVLGQAFGCFVPAHPIAGSEQSGVEHADADLYRGKQVVLTPTESTFARQLDQATQVWKALNCHVINMSPQSHDAAYAAVSHLPHLIAFAYINAIAGQEQGKNYLALAGSGFKDFTRIAASDPAMWRDIFLANREQLLYQTQHFQSVLQVFEKFLLDGQGEDIEGFIQQASQARTAWQPDAHLATQQK